MGKFEQNIPAFIETLEKQRKDRDLERFNINWGHDCDCEYCDRDGDDADPEAENIAAEIEKDVKNYTHQINLLKRHAELHGVKLKDETEKKS